MYSSYQLTHENPMVLDRLWDDGLETETEAAQRAEKEDYDVKKYCRDDLIVELKGILSDLENGCKEFTTGELLDQVQEWTADIIKETRELERMVA